MSGIKASQAFAARREFIIRDLVRNLHEELVPAFNAECVDIKKVYDETVSYAQDCPTDVAKKKLIELAESNRKARIFDLNFRKRQFIDGLNLDLKMQSNKWVEEYKGETFEEQEEDRKRVDRDGKPKMRTVVKAKFPDGSSAKIPQQLYIDTTLFDRA